MLMVFHSTGWNQFYNGPGKASANLYSLIETAKASCLESNVYLRKVFSEIPNATVVEDFEALLPWNVQKNRKKASRLENGVRSALTNVTLKT